MSIAEFIISKMGIVEVLPEPKKPDVIVPEKLQMIIKVDAETNRYGLVTLYAINGETNEGVDIFQFIDPEHPSGTEHEVETSMIKFELIGNHGPLSDIDLFDTIVASVNPGLRTQVIANAAFTNGGHGMGEAINLSKELNGVFQKMRSEFSNVTSH